MVLPRKVALTVDLEEWRVPEDFRTGRVPEEVKLRVTREGLHVLLEILGEEGVKATFFVTRYFAERNRAILRDLLSAGHEVGAHGTYHVRASHENANRNLESLRETTSALEAVLGTRPRGYREPYFEVRKSTLTALMQVGYLYDSSILGTWLPEKLHWIQVPTTPFVWTSPSREGKLVELPVSVFPKLRIPVGWWWFRKNFGELPLTATARLYFGLDQPIVTNVHPWELAQPPQGYRIPFHVAHNCGGKSAKQIVRLIAGLKNLDAEFVLMTNLAVDTAMEPAVSV